MFFTLYTSSLSDIRLANILQGRNRDADVENGCVDTMQGKRDGMNWEFEIDIYTLPCVK